MAQSIYVLKEIIDLYRILNGSSVFVCFLGASDAFDRVNHRTLFEQLAARGVPGYIIANTNLLAYEPGYVYKMGVMHNQLKLK